MASYHDKNKLKLGDINHDKQGLRNGYVKPSGKFWKRRFNKRVRRGAVHKRDNHFEWC